MGRDGRSETSSLFSGAGLRLRGTTGSSKASHAPRIDDFRLPAAGPLGSPVGISNFTTSKPNWLFLPKPPHLPNCYHFPVSHPGATAFVQNLGHLPTLSTPPATPRATWINATEP